MAKNRLDKVLVDRKLVGSRERARVLIINGGVFVDGKVFKKPDVQIEDEVKIEIKGEDLKWVSRSALKLEKALDVWNIDVKDKICLDVGASTGGFTEVLLERGAKKVYALDVGHDQLAEKLKNDKRVVSVEKINARNINNDIINEKVDFICIDVSFISLTLIVPEIVRFLKKSGGIVALIKPQFEVGIGGLGKGGIVRDVKQHKIAIEKIEKMIESISLKKIGLMESPILGGDGNKEFLICFKK